MTKEEIFDICISEGAYNDCDQDITECINLGYCKLEELQEQDDHSYYDEPGDLGGI